MQYSGKFKIYQLHTYFFITPVTFLSVVEKYKQKHIFWGIRQDAKPEVFGPSTSLLVRPSLVTLPAKIRARLSLWRVKVRFAVECSTRAHYVPAKCATGAVHILQRPLLRAKMYNYLATPSRLPCRCRCLGSVLKTTAATYLGMWACPLAFPKRVNEGDYPQFWHLVFHIEGNIQGEERDILPESCTRRLG